MYINVCLPVCPGIMASDAAEGTGDVLQTTKDVWRCAEAYRTHHPAFVVVAFVLVYVTFQTFAIPGPIVLSILAGALYPRYQRC
jgi:hypothetical protein